MKPVSVAGLLPGAHGWPWPRLSLRAGPLPSERKDVRLASSWQWSRWLMTVGVHRCPVTVNRLTRRCFLNCGFSVEISVTQASWQVVEDVFHSRGRDAPVTPPSPPVTPRQPPSPGREPASPRVRHLLWLSAPRGPRPRPGGRMDADLELRGREGAQLTSLLRGRTSPASRPTEQPGWEDGRAWMCCPPPPAPRKEDT